MCWRGHRDWEEGCAASLSKSTAGGTHGKRYREVAATWGADIPTAIWGVTADIPTAILVHPPEPLAHQAPSAGPLLPLPPPPPHQ